VLKQTNIISPASVISHDSIISHAKFEIPGGIHPPEHKSISNQTNIAWLAPAKELILPLSKQHGIEGQQLVDVGEHVSAGQKLFSTALNQITTNTHSPYDGEVLEVADKNLGHASGLLVSAICIKPLSKQIVASMPPIAHWLQATPADLIDKIHEAGIVGMGGAAFPTHIKLKSGVNSIEILIVNGMECEPYITCDDRLLREHSWEILQGALITAKIVDAKQILFGIEDNKPEAIEALTQQIDKYLQQNIDSNMPSPKIQIIVAKTKYPSGGEKQLIQLLTGLQVPQNQYPAAIGLLVQNIATLFAINDAVCNGQTLTHRVVTLTGDLVNKPGNYWIAFGTPLAHIISELKIDTKRLSKIILGGPLMGQAISDLNIPTQKSTNCIIFNSEKADRLTVSPNNFHDPCIRCGECEKVCPASLLPQQLYWFAQSEQWEKLEQHNLFDCIECGACSYVCPSDIPLVNYYRFSKSEIRHLKIKQKKSELAKQRFENRENRIKRIKNEREAKRKKTAEARKLAASNQNEDPDGKLSAIEAALQRVKNKKEEQS
jgi:electron transport complex protein RnfC